MLSQLRPAIVLSVMLSAVTGLLYPLAITGAAQAAIPFQANGSPIVRDGVLVGSALVGQNFSAARYFWPRPSATGTEPYNGAASSGSNIGPTGKALIERVADAVMATGETTVPGDAVTTSGSGLDPHITPQYAAMQVARVATERGVPVEVIEAIVARVTEMPFLGIVGEPRVHVLELNMALDEAVPAGN